MCCRPVATPGQGRGLQSQKFSDVERASFRPDRENLDYKYIEFNTSPASSNGPVGLLVRGGTDANDAHPPPKLGMVGKCTISCDLHA